MLLWSCDLFEPISDGTSESIVRRGLDVPGTVDPRFATRFAGQYTSPETAQAGLVTLEVKALMPSGAPDNVVRVVTENSCTLKFSSRGLE